MFRPTRLLILPGILIGACCFADLPKTESTPYDDTPHTIPGRIEAEHYDDGPPDIAYHDIDKANLGEPYRKDTQVDIEKRDDASNGHGIGWTREKEWLLYTVDVKASATYEIEIPVASQKRGGTFHLEVDDKDISGPIKVPDTGSWAKLKMITHKGVKLKKGIQTIKVVMDKQGLSGSIGDIDYFEFTAIMAR